MKALVTAFICLLGICIGTARGADDFTAHAWQMESKGDAAEARDYLQHAAQTGGVDAATGLRTISRSASRSRGA